MCQAKFLVIPSRYYLNGWYNHKSGTHTFERILESCNSHGGKGQTSGETNARKSVHSIVRAGRSEIWWDKMKPLLHIIRRTHTLKNFLAKVGLGFLPESPENRVQLRKEHARDRDDCVEKRNKRWIHVVRNLLDRKFVNFVLLPILFEYLKH